MAPQTRTYNQVLKAYRRSRLPGAAGSAEGILRRMLRSGNEGIRPDVISFSTCLDAWATRAASPERPNTPVAAGADCLRPNEVAYDAVLNACAFSAFAPEEERRRALAIAVAAFREIGVLPYVGPDVVTYGMMLKCVANLVPMGEGEARVSMAGDLFGGCCGDSRATLS